MNKTFSEEVEKQFIDLTLATGNSQRQGNSLLGRGMKVGISRWELGQIKGRQLIELMTENLEILMESGINRVVLMG